MKFDRYLNTIDRLDSQDTVKLLRYGYNSVPNERIFAGQLDPNSISQMEISNVEVFPNPTNGNITLKIPSVFSDSYSINIINSVGQLVYNSNLEVDDLTITLNLEIPNGFYEIQLINSDQILKGTILVQR